MIISLIKRNIIQILTALMGMVETKAQGDLETVLYSTVSRSPRSYSFNSGPKNKLSIFVLYTAS